MKMPSCAVKGCKNSSGSVKMNVLSKNPEQRKLWIKNSGVNPSKHSVLCEFHFTSDMWEKERVDGTKKLKCNAVPTIFRDQVYQHSHTSKGKMSGKASEKKELFAEINHKTEEDPILHETAANKTVPALIKKSEYNSECQLESGNIQLDEPEASIIGAKQGSRENSDLAFLGSSTSKTSNDNFSLQDEENALKSLQNNFSADSKISLEKNNVKLEQLYLKSERLRSLMKKRYQQKYRIWKNIINRLQKSNEDRMKKIFNADQFQIISGQHYNKEKIYIPDLPILRAKLSNAELNTLHHIYSWIFSFEHCEKSKNLQKMHNIYWSI